MVTFDARDPGTTNGEWMSDPRLAHLPLFSLTGVDRMLVVAAHPDDETLGAGVVLASAFASGIPADVVIVTDGGASHPASPTTDGPGLIAQRAAEAMKAVALLHPAATLTFLAIPDGRLDQHTPIVRAALAARLAPHRAATPPPAPASGTPAAAAPPAATPASAAPPAVTSPGAPARTLLVAPWRGDGHRDHRVLGEICAALAAEHDASETGRALEFVEYPIWLWHWSSPSDPATPWPDFVALPATSATREAKARALAAYRSQTEPLSPAPGDAALLNPTFLANFDRAAEVLIVADNTTRQATASQPAAATPANVPPPAAAPPATIPPPPSAAPPAAPKLSGSYFDETYARHDDPWGFTDRWYEQRKRAVTLSSLPRPRVASTLEIGCSIGVLTEQLAPISTHVLAVDIAPAAIARARTRLGEHPNVEFAVADVSEAFPSGTFDLVLLSEVGYYFDAATLGAVLADTAAALSPDGVFVACHWRHPVSDYLQTGDGVHAGIAAAASTHGWTLLTHHLERDFVLDVYSPDPRSVAKQTGLA